jgi:acetolactate synthase-1/2/3 large subunit
MPSAPRVAKERLTSAEAIVRTLRQHGIDTVFGLPGAQMYALWDALAQAKGELRTVTSRHEQGAAYMALGAAKSTGRPAVYTVVPGPGVLNTAAALCTAFGTNAPVLCLTGQVPSAFLGQGRGHLHELPDQLATLASITKWAARIGRPEDAPGLIHEAFRRMQSGRPGPVSLEMCWDLLGAEGEVTIGDGPGTDPHPAIDPDALAAAAKLVAAAKHPMIMVGGGAQHASAAVRALAEMLDAPVTALRSGRGVVAEDHPLGVSSWAAYKLWPDTDLLIGIGSRLELQTMRWGGGMMRRVERPETPVVRIDIDPAEMKRLVPNAGLVADAADGAYALAEAVARKVKKQKGARERIAAAKAAAERDAETVQPMKGYLDAIRAVLPRDGFFVEELCQAGFTSYFAFPVYEPRTYVTAGYQGTLGFGYPTSLGVKVANPGKPVVSISGDGGFLFGLGEVATAVQEKIGVVAVLFNNSAFGNVRRDQAQQFGGRFIGSDLVNPDFIKLAESFGVRAERAATPKALRPALERALAADVPALIEVPVDASSEVSPWPFIMPQPPAGK